MVPGIYNITIYRGGTFEIDLSAKDTAGDISFSEIYTKAELHIYEAWLTSVDPDLATPLYTLSTEDGTITIMGTIVRLFLSAEITAALPFISGVYRLKLIVDGIDPIVDFFLEGSVKVKN